MANCKVSKLAVKSGNWVNLREFIKLISNKLICLLQINTDTMTSLLSEAPHTSALYNPWSKAAFDNIGDDPNTGLQFLPAATDSKNTSSMDMFGLGNSNSSGGFAAYDCVSRVLDDDEQSMLDGTFSAGASFNGASFNSSSFSATIGPPKQFVPTIPESSSSNGAGHLDAFSVNDRLV